MVEQTSSDWLRNDAEMAQRVRMFDWEATPLGPLLQWPVALRAAAALVLDHPLPMALGWGPDLITIYNDAYRPLLGAKAEALGRPFLEVWGEARDIISPQIADALAGRTVRFEEALFTIERGGGLEEAWFDYSYSPLRDEVGTVVGLLNTAFERTADVLAEQQQSEADAALRESEERQAFLLKFSDALRAQPDEQSIKDLTVKMVAEHMRLDRFWIAEVINEEGIALVGPEHNGAGLQPMSGTFQLSDYPENMRQLVTQAIQIPNIPDDPRFSASEKELLAGLKIVGLLVAPLRKGEGNVIWAFPATTTMPRRWTDNERRLLEDIAERTWAAIQRARVEADLRTSQEVLAADLASAELLRRLAERTVSAGDLAAVHDEILSATVAIACADAGTIQVFDPDAKTLEIIASRNFSRTITDYFRRVDAGSLTACGLALRTGQRAFVDFPDKDGDYGCQLLVGEGIQAAMALPLVSRAGVPLGMLNAHWREARHRPDDRELRFLDLLARQAADLIEQRRGEAALRESEARFRQFGDASSDVLWMVDAATGQVEYLSPAFESIWGIKRELVLADRSIWSDTLHPEDRDRASTAFPRALTGEAVVLEYRIVRSDGRIRYITDAGFPIFDSDGQVVRVGGIAQDLTERRLAEQAVRTIERQQRALIEGIPQLVWRAGEPGHWTWASPQWTEFTGQSMEDSLEWGWLNPVHPDDRDLARDAWLHAIEHGRFEAEYRICAHEAGTYRWFQTRATPVRDETGVTIEWLGTSTDINDLRELQARQGVLVAELQHRTRNLITVVNAVSRQTLKNVTTLDEFKHAFGDRLAALSRVQGLLSHLSAGQRVTFQELLRSELAALGAPDDKVTLDGPTGVPLKSATVQTFSLALHELATNALKYGALASPDGHLTVRWKVSADEGPRRLQVDWRESGVVMTQVGDRPWGGGYGRELIQRALPYQLGAKTSYALTPDGVHCTINVPISAAKE